MECQQCGSALRPGARFCNACGARQDITDAQAGTSAADGESPEGELAADAGASAGRAKRPPRIPRAETSDATRARETAAPVLTSILDLPADSQGPGQQAAPETSESVGDTVEDGETSDSADVEQSEVNEAAATALDGGATLAPADVAADDEAGVTPEPDATPGEAGQSNADLEQDAVVDVGVAPGDSDRAVPAQQPADTAAAPELPPLPDWTEAETAEYDTIVTSRRPTNGSNGAFMPESGMPSLSELGRGQGGKEAGVEMAAATSWRDGMPWPLPTSIIVGGRYRVEAVISTMPDGVDAENTYRVRDLQGYERCWSCGSAHGAGAAAETFCEKCGADMLARDYLMSERYLEADESQVPAPERHDHDDVEEGDEDAATELDVRVFTQGARAYRITPLVAETPLFPRGARITGAAATDTGATRAGEANEDSLGLMTLNLAHGSRVEPFALVMVADGLGGHANGQEASRLVVQRLTERVLRSAALPFTEEPRAAAHETFESVAISALREGIESGNAALCERNAASGADMGSTLVALLAFGSMAYIANVGDSRAYVLDDDGLRRITTDHSLVEQLVAAGQIAPEDRYTHPQRNQILRSIGDEMDVRVDVFQQQLRPGMRFLLCSDGLWEMVRDDQCERILRDAASPQRACDLLIEAANANGGEDNITAIVVEVSA